MCVIEDHPKIETRRLQLRAPDHRDAERIADLANDWDVARMTSSLPHPYGPSDARRFFDRIDAQDPRTHATFLIEHGRKGPVGMVGLHGGGGRHSELGYWIGKPFWGQGIATEAALATLDWARRAWRRRAVMAGHFIDNPASGRVLEKAGFLYTGEVLLKPSAARGGTAPLRSMVWLA
jgi:RimJ/RimL family protein N-acetyltransferase